MSVSDERDRRFHMMCTSRDCIVARPNVRLTLPLLEIAVGALCNLYEVLRQRLHNERIRFVIRVWRFHSKDGTVDEYSVCLRQPTQKIIAVSSQYQLDQACCKC